MRFILTTLIVALISFPAFSQNYKTLVKKSWDSYGKGDFQQAISYLEQALPDAKKALEKEYEKKGPVNPDYFTYSVLLNDLGTYYDQIGMKQQALLYTEQALEAQQKYVFYGESSMTMANLGTYYSNNGDYQAAEEQLLKAYEKGVDKEYLEQGISVVQKFRIGSALANFYTKMGRFEDAIEIYDFFLPLLKKYHGEENYTYLRALSNYTTFLPNDSTNWKIETLQNCLTILDGKLENDIMEEDDHSVQLLYLQIEGLLVSTLFEAERVEESKTHIDHILQVSREFVGTKSRIYEDYVYLKGNYFYLINEYDSAKLTLDPILKADPQTLSELAYLKAYIKVLLATKEPVDSHFEVLIKSYMRMINELVPTFDEDQRKKFYDSLRPSFLLYFDYLFKTMNFSKVGEVLDLQIGTKGILLNTFISVKTKILKSGDPELLNKYYRWMDLRQSVANPDQVEESDRLERELSVAVKDLHIGSVKSVGWEDVSKSLSKNEAALEIIRLEKFDRIDDSRNKKYARFGFSSPYYAIVIMKAGEDPKSIIIENGTELEGRSFNYYRNALKYQVEDRQSYQSYWQPISQMLNGVKKVYISPDGVYNQLSIGSLKNIETDQFVMDELSIQLITNLKEILSPASKEIAKNTAQLYGRPQFSNTVATGSQRSFLPLTDLPGTEIEVNSINTLLGQKGWNSTAYLGELANENQLKSASATSILHIATHGYFINDQSDRDVHPLLNAGLLLTANNVSDGMFTAYEATGLDLEETQLVVLSACETGLGKVSNGEGVYGLQRGFKVAGAKNILMSLWKVDDQATSELMSIFYENLVNRELQPTEALNLAQKSLRNKYNHPYYWGAFVMVGK